MIKKKEKEKKKTPYYASEFLTLRQEVATPTQACRTTLPNSPFHVLAHYFVPVVIFFFFSPQATDDDGAEDHQSGLSAS